MAVETLELENTNPPDRLVAEIATGNVCWDSRYEGQLLLIRVCRACQCAKTSCICDAPIIDAILIWRQGQGVNERLVKYLKGKKAVHDAEKSFPTFKLHTPEEMKKRMTLWMPIKGVPSHHPAAIYMRKLFAEGDRVLVQLIHATETWIKKDDVYYTSRDGKTYQSRTGQTLLVNKDTEGKLYIGEVGVKENLVSPQASTKKEPRSLADATDEVFIQTLKDKNEDGWNIYVTMNPIHAESKTRRKGDIADIRSVYCEVDEDGEVCIQAIRASVAAGEIPRPSIVLESSPGKYQVIWFVKDFTAPAQEALNKALQAKFKTDPKSVDCSRVLRLPNFYNQKPKYATPPLVSVFSKSPATERYSPSDFKIDTEEKSAAPVGSAAPPEIIKEICSELEKSLTEANLEPRGVITGGTWIYQFSFVCPNPLHTTVDRIRSVSVRVDGWIGSHCYHANCDGKDWKKWMRPWLEEAIGRKLHFPKPEAKTETGTNAEASGTVCVFEEASDVEVARNYLGLDAIPVTEKPQTLRTKYEHIVLFGTTQATQALRKAIGVGAEIMGMPPDKKATPEIRYGQKKYPPCKTLVDAVSQYEHDELEKYFQRIIGLDAIQKYSTKKETAEGVQLESYADVEMDLQEWIWDAHIPVGALALMVGNPDVGKSLGAIDLVARVTKGLDFPGGSPNEFPPSDVVLCEAEDDRGKTIKPRLSVAAEDEGADMSHVFEMHFKPKGNTKKRMVQLDKDLEMIENKVKGIPNCRLLVFSPITAYLGTTVKTIDDASVRSILTPLQEMAARLGIAVVAVMHLNKSSEYDVIYRVSGAMGFVAVARATWLFARDVNDKSGESRFMIPIKGNLAVAQKGISFRIGASKKTVAVHDRRKNQMVNTHPPRIFWGETTDVDANDIMRETTPKAADQLEGAKVWLASLFNDTKTGEWCDRPLPLMEYRKALRGVSIPQGTIKRAQAVLGVIYDGKTQAFTMMPPAVPDVNPDREAGRPPQTTEENISRIHEALAKKVRETGQGPELTQSEVTFLFSHKTLAEKNALCIAAGLQAETRAPSEHGGQSTTVWFFPKKA